MSYWWLKNLYDFNLSQLVRITLFAVRKSFLFCFSPESPLHHTVLPSELVYIETLTLPRKFNDTSESIPFHF